MVQTCSCSLCTRTSAERCLGWLCWLRAGTVGCERIASPAVASQMLPRVAAHAAAALDQLLRSAVAPQWRGVGGVSSWCCVAAEAACKQTHTQPGWWHGMLSAIT